MVSFICDSLNSIGDRWWMGVRLVSEHYILLSAAIHIPFVLFSSFVCSSKKSENTERSSLLTSSSRSARKMAKETAAIPAGKTVDKHPLFHTKETNTPKKRTHKTKHSRRSVSDLLICNTQQSEARNKKQKQDSPRKIGKSDRVVSKTQTESPVPPAKNAKSIHPSSDISNRKGSQSQKR
ncbi:hypothetical protein DICVIV_01283 [Dictyocaulus viviparus]|uniref:Uncharacterized protein n=1 Tax=Dictyocaulus viviparus TaxID=29172 RepID=A0A0D8Y6S6_DICVI|nr:hypothetical protein DICVIV_01283 [Dictyocaulus viviparus]